MRTRLTAGVFFMSEAKKTESVMQEKREGTEEFFDTYFTEREEKQRGFCEKELGKKQGFCYNGNRTEGFF